MARVRMITRTISVTEVTAICCDTIKLEVTKKTYELTGVTNDPDKILKALKREYETDTTKIMALDTVVTREEMYGIKESDFLKVATKLDPTTRKAYENLIEE